MEYVGKGRDEATQLKKILPPILAFLKNHFSEILEFIFQENYSLNWKIHKGSLQQQNQMCKTASDWVQGGERDAQV